MAERLGAERQKTRDVGLRQLEEVKSGERNIAPGRTIKTYFVKGRVSTREYWTHKKSGKRSNEYRESYKIDALRVRATSLADAKKQFERSVRQNFDFDHYEKQSKVLKIEVGEGDVKTEDEYKRNPIAEGKTLMDDDEEGSKRMKASVNVDYDFIPSEASDNSSGEDKSDEDSSEGEDEEQDEDDNEQVEEEEEFEDELKEEDSKSVDDENVNNKTIAYDETLEDDGDEGDDEEESHEQESKKKESKRMSTETVGYDDLDEGDEEEEGAADVELVEKEEKEIIVDGVELEK
jgi:hypothetical protein